LSIYLLRLGGGGGRGVQLPRSVRHPQRAIKIAYLNYVSWHESRWGHHLILAHLRRVDFHPLPVGAAVHLLSVVGDPSLRRTIMRP
jgi:hypothetical protein